jgi:hypothetical protein
VSAKVIPLRQLEPASAAQLRGWVHGEICSRDGVDYEVVTAGQIESLEWRRGRKGAEKTSKNVLDLLSGAGAQVGDLVLVLRPRRRT